MQSKQYFPLVVFALLLVGGALSGGQRTFAGPVTTAIIDFGKAGDVQSFTGTGVGSGSLIADGTGAAAVIKGKVTEVQPFVILPPVSHPVTVFNDMSSQGGTAGLKIATSPASVRVAVPVVPATDPPTKVDVSVTRFDFQDGQVSDIRELDLNLFNGVNVPFALSQVLVTTNTNNPILKSVPIDVVGNVSNLKFDQTAAASLVPTGIGTGSFSIPGALSLQITSVKALIFELIGQDIDPQTLTSKINLTGTYKITGPRNDAKIELAGSAVGVPYMIATHSLLNLVFGEELVPLTVQGTIDVVTTMSLDFAYQLSVSHVVVPEPGSIVLLAIGLVLCVVASRVPRFPRE
jgi:hypothetical protein